MRGVFMRCHLRIPLAAQGRSPVPRPGPLRQPVLMACLLAESASAPLRAKRPSSHLCPGPEAPELDEVPSPTKVRRSADERPPRLAGEFRMQRLPLLGQLATEALMRWQCQHLLDLGLFEVPAAGRRRLRRKTPITAALLVDKLVSSFDAPIFNTTLEW